jgi:hypothetical protein
MLVSHISFNRCLSTEYILLCPDTYHNLQDAENAIMRNFMFYILVFTEQNLVKQAVARRVAGKKIREVLLGGCGRKRPLDNLRE